MVESLLDQVPGLGEVRRKALMTHFGSLKKLRQATVEEIALVPGFGPKMAQNIKEALEATPQREAVNTATGEIISDEPLVRPAAATGGPAMPAPAPAAVGPSDGRAGTGPADGEPGY